MLVSISAHLTLSAAPLMKGNLSVSIFSLLQFVKNPAHCGRSKSFFSFPFFCENINCERHNKNNNRIYFNLYKAGVVTSFRTNSSYEINNECLGYNYKFQDSIDSSYGENRINWTTMTSNKNAIELLRDRVKYEKSLYNLDIKEYNKLINKINWKSGLTSTKNAIILLKDLLI